MYMRIGSKNGDLKEEQQKVTHLHLDGIVLLSRIAVDDYIKKLEAMRDALWPRDPEPGGSAD
jgi:hypothetical protein